MRYESIASVTFNLKTNIYQQKSSDIYFNREVLNNSMLEIGRTAEASYIIWDLSEWE